MQNASASTSCARLLSRRSILVWHYNVLVPAPHITSFSHLSDREGSRNAPHNTGPCAATSLVRLAVPPLLRTARRGVERTSASLECVRSRQIVAGTHYNICGDSGEGKNTKRGRIQLLRYANTVDAFRKQILLDQHILKCHTIDGHWRDNYKFCPSAIGQGNPGHYLTINRYSSPDGCTFAILHIIKYQLFNPTPSYRDIAH